VFKAGLDPERVSRFAGTFQSSQVPASTADAMAIAAAPAAKPALRSLFVTLFMTFLALLEGAGT
jgi:hypothetical protein